MNTIDLSVSNLAATRGRHYDIAILPWGATEPHNLHLPYLTDSILSHDIAVDAAAIARDTYGIPAMVLPPVTMGSQNPGNNFRNMIRDLAVDRPDFLIATCEWFKTASPKPYFDIIGDHADELETSVMMHYHPELVDITQAGPGEAPGFRAPALRNGIVWTPRNWTLAAGADTGVGDPRAATPEKGRLFAADCATSIAAAIADLCDPAGPYFPASEK